MCFYLNLAWFETSFEKMFTVRFKHELSMETKLKKKYYEVLIISFANNILDIN